MTLARRKNEPTVDAINLALGVFLFLAPWIFAFHRTLQGRTRGIWAR
jgi:hypothetical protein